MPTIADTGSLFGHALRSRADGHRPYPSGGALYSIESYIVFSPDAAEETGVYHYQPSGHTLEHLWNTPQTFKTQDLFPPEHPSVYPALIVLTAVWNKYAHAYGDFGYMLGLLEAGHVSQSLCLAAIGLDLSICPLAGFDDEKITELLDLDSRSEQTILVLSLGRRERVGKAIIG